MPQALASRAGNPTWFERIYPLLRWLMAGHWLLVNRVLRRLCAGASRRQVLDIGGRKSHYTAGVNCDVTIIDLPRASEVQQSLRLGLNGTVIAQMSRRRGNIAAIVLGDMTKAPFAEGVFDGVVAVEVIEHVPDDSAFVAQACRVLRPGGWFVLTTPNGESVPLKNVDHVRHYRRVELEEKLAEQFQEVDVWYAVKRDRLHRFSMRSWVRPKGVGGVLAAPFVMLGVLVSNIRDVLFRPPLNRSEHLFAIAHKRPGDGSGM